MDGVIPPTVTSPSLRKQFNRFAKMKNPWDAARFMYVQVLRTYLMRF
jgi:hypothetical protein